MDEKATEKEKVQNYLINKLNNQENLKQRHHMFQDYLFIQVITV